MKDHRDWIAWAIEALRGEQYRSADTHLINVPLADAPGINLYLKDESGHPTGSLKHRLARSLFMYALCNGWIGPETTIVESSSGSTAVSEAYFARLLGLRFVAVIPSSTAPSKIEAIKSYGGICQTVSDPREACSAASRIAVETRGYYMDQFTYAERASDWRDESNLAHRIFLQMGSEQFANPTWIVCGAGTGGTSATIGRYLRYKAHKTRLCVADPSASVYHRHFADRSIMQATGPMSCVEGIGRPRVEPSFIPDVIDRMIAIADPDSLAAARHLSRVLGKRCGPSTGTNICASLELVSEMIAANEQGSIVTLMCDSGERYVPTCYDDTWVAARGATESCRNEWLNRFLPAVDIAP